MPPRKTPPGGDPPMDELEAQIAFIVDGPSTVADKAREIANLVNRLRSLDIGAIETKQRLLDEANDRADEIVKDLRREEAATRALNAEIEALHNAERQLVADIADYVRYLGSDEIAEGIETGQWKAPDVRARVNRAARIRALRSELRELTQAAHEDGDEKTGDLPMPEEPDHAG